MNNLLAQSKELKRLKKEAERRKLEEAEEKELDDAEAHARAVEEFEQVQAGLNARSASERIVGRRNGKIIVEQDVEGKGVKRKLEVDEDELKNLATNGSTKTRRRDSEQQDGNSELPSFWVPGKTPDNKKAAAKAVKQQPTCPAAEIGKEHDFSLKTLITVQFNDDQSSNASEAPIRTCPSCNKALSNTTKAIVAKPCGHVLCKPCSDRFQASPERTAHDTNYDDTRRCYVCQEDITPGRRVKPKRGDVEDGKEKESKAERGLVELSTEGTGFAGGGKNMVKKSGLAFQC